MTSYSESFGLVLLEAFSFGVPAIAFDSASGPCELINTNNGILVSNRDKNLMADNIIKSAENALIDYLLYDGKNHILNDDLYDYRSKVSGGEKQRISIARVFLKDPTILLLDEPTSSLDKKNEIEITKNIDKLMKGKTRFIATYRLDSIIDADDILIFKNGELIKKVLIKN